MFNSKVINEYSINLMWINKSLNDSQKYICSDSRRTSKDNTKILIESAIKWKQLNPNANVNIWYDGLLTTKKAVANTIAELKSKNSQEMDIQFKDIRDINLITHNPDIFSAQMPLYFRVDLLKLVICTAEAEHAANDAAIFTDIEVTAIGENTLFNKESMQKLEQFGMLINESTGFLSGPENQFIQIINDSKLLASLKHTINTNLLRGAFALNVDKHLEEYAQENNLSGKELQKYIMSKIYTVAFFSTLNEVLLHYIANNKGSIKINLDLFSDEKSGGWVTYDVNKHGYRPFGDCHDRGASGVFLVSSIDNGKPVARGRLLRFFDEDGKKITSSLSEKHRNASTRNDIEVRAGAAHGNYDFALTIPPVNNNTEYKCTFWEDAEKLKLATEVNDLTELFNDAVVEISCVLDEESNIDDMALGNNQEKDIFLSSDGSLGEQKITTQQP